MAEVEDVLPDIETSYSWTVQSLDEVLNDRKIEHDGRTLTIRAGLLQRGKMYNVSVIGIHVF